MPQAAFALTLLMVMSATALAVTSARAQNDPFHIVLAGDSTVTDHAGWGTGFSGSFRDHVTVTNLAKGGRSSKSFRDEGWWQQVLDAEPDYVVIQFGHNDIPGKGPERETDAATTFRENLARYVDEARDVGATPILVTSLERRRWTDDGQWARETLAEYAEATRAVAGEKDVTLIDLHAQSIDVYKSLGPEAVKDLSPIEDDGKVDETHLNDWGGKLIGNMVADMLRREIDAFDEAWDWRGNAFPDVREGKERERPLTHGPKETPTPKGESTLVVDPDATEDSGAFRTVQAALLAVPDNNADRTFIDIKPGIYFGPIIVGREKQNVTFRGHGTDETILTYALNVKAPLSDSQGYFLNGCGVTVLGDGFHAENLTFRNTSGDYGQAMALRTQAERVVVKDCHLLGWQDTLYTHSGRAYFENCHIEGRVDFIYGGAAAVFKDCVIKSKRGGYVTASRAPEEQPFGLVFMDCELVSDDGVPTFLGRPWRPFAAVAYLNCAMGGHIRPEGWDNWRNPDNEKTARYSEYRSTGPGAAPDARVAWSRQLTDDEAAAYTVENILGGDDGWDPRAR